MAKTKAMQEIEKERGKPIEAVLRELYQQHGSQAAVAAALGIDPSTLSLWLLRLGLEQRTVLVDREMA